MKIKVLILFVVILSTMLSAITLPAEARAPPGSYLLTYIVIAAGLIVSGFAVVKNNNNIFFQRNIKMKKYFKNQVVIPLAVITAAIAIGIACNAIGAYFPNTPITDVNITSPNDVDTVVVNRTYNFTCTTSTDTDSNECYPVADTVTHTWSGSGTWEPQTSTDVNWTAPYVLGDVNLTVTADDSPLYDETAKTDTITLTIDGPTTYYSLDPNKISGGEYHTLVLMDDGNITFLLWIQTTTSRPGAQTAAG